MPHTIARAGRDRLTRDQQRTRTCSSGMCRHRQFLRAVPHHSGPQRRARIRCARAQGVQVRGARRAVAGSQQEQCRVCLPCNHALHYTCIAAPHSGLVLVLLSHAHARRAPPNRSGRAAPSHSQHSATPVPDRRGIERAAATCCTRSPVAAGPRHFAVQAHTAGRRAAPLSGTP